MKAPRDPRPYLRDILDSIERIRLYTDGLELADFLRNSVVQDAVVRRIEIMGEAVACLPDELRQAHPEVAWQGVKRMTVVRADVPQLEPHIRRILDAL